MTRLVLMPARATPEIGLAPGCPREALISEPSRDNVSVVRFIRIAAMDRTASQYAVSAKASHEQLARHGKATRWVGVARLSGRIEVFYVVRRSLVRGSSP